MLKDKEVKEACFKITRHIVGHGRVSSDDFFKLAGTYEKEVKLLALNIFATVSGSDWITFKSKPIEVVAREIVAGTETAASARRWAVRQS